jgi:hypothetical protein
MTISRLESSPLNSTPMNFPETHKLLIHEGYLIHASLTSGLTALRSAGTHDKGKFYSALFNLSIGIERLCKSVIIIDRMLRNNMIPPSESEMKQFGHNLKKLHAAVSEISRKRQISFDELDKYDSVTNSIVALIDDFALRSRYHNLDKLGAGGKSKDPLEEWQRILSDVLSTDYKKSAINKKLAHVKKFTDLIKDNSFVMSTGLDGKSLSFDDAFAEPALQEMALKHVNLRLIKLLTPFRDLMGDLCREVYAYGPIPCIPQMQEFLSWIWDDKAYVLRKKVWP